jgi:hypothetical protein
MPLDGSALAARKILHAAACGFERIMDHQLKIDVRRLWFGAVQVGRFPIHRCPLMRDGLALDDNFFPWQGQVDANVEGLAFLVMAMRDLNGDAAPDDAVVESFEFLGLPPNPVLYFGGMLHVPKGDLQWKRHGPLPGVSSFHKAQCHFS